MKYLIVFIMLFGCLNENEDLFIQEDCIKDTIRLIDCVNIAVQPVMTSQLWQEWQDLKCDSDLITQCIVTQADCDMIANSPLTIDLQQRWNDGNCI